MPSATTPNAKIAIYKIIRLMKTIQCYSTCIFAKLFTTKVQPILLYGSEIWGCFKLVDIERVQMFAFKSFLKLPSHCSNSLLYGETGRYPLHICSIMNSLRYWVKLLKLPTSRLNKQANLMLLNMHNSRHNNWANSIKEILETNGFSYLWTIQAVANKNSFLSMFRERLTDCFYQTWSEKIKSKEKFALYCKIKSLPGTESCLNDLSVIPYRVALIRFRLCSSQITCHK